MGSARQQKLAICVSPAELALLKKLNFPGSEAALASATRTEDGIRLTGTVIDFTDLVGWVAGEANDADRRGAAAKMELLDRIFEELESVLRSAPAGGRLPGPRVPPLN